MELQMQVTEKNLKPLVASLQCLLKIGKELSIECEGTSGMTFRTLNDAHSASAEITFEREFFEDIRLVTPMGTPQMKGIPFIKCKVYTKYCCNMFRTLKSVRGLQIIFLLGEQHQEADEEEEDEIEVECLEIVWKLVCDFEITKTHRMKVQECQIMRAIFDRENAPNRYYKVDR
jgi:cell cycle checkpoint control protein RAD9A